MVSSLKFDVGCLAAVTTTAKVDFTFCVRSRLLNQQEFACMACLCAAGANLAMAMIFVCIGCTEIGAANVVASCGTVQ